MVEYTVDDEGPGIAETEIERIFDIYVTKAAGETAAPALGLPLSRRLARLLGGELRARAPRPAKAAASFWSSRPRPHHEEAFMMASRGVQHRSLDCRP